MNALRRIERPLPAQAAAPALPAPPALLVGRGLVAPARSPASLLVAGAAMTSVGSGLIHVAAVPEHWATYRIAALFFIALGVFQVVWAALMVGRPTLRLAVAGAAVSLGTIAVWVVSRTSGLPFGPFAGIPERAGRADVISTILEEAVVVAVLLLAFGVGGARRLDRRSYRTALAALRGASAGFSAWALSAAHDGHAGGGNPLAHLAGHHGVHLLFAGGAVGVYAVYLIAHIRRHGWPSFSWRLDPVSAAGPSARRPSPSPAAAPWRPR